MGFWAFLLPMILSTSMASSVGEQLRSRLMETQFRWPETMACVLIAVLIVVYYRGSRINRRIATEWFNNIKPILQVQFAKVGAYQGAAQNRVLIKDSESAYRLYSSGRRACGGLLATLQLKKRQDLVSIFLDLFGIVRDYDRCTIEIPFETESMEPFVLMVCKRRDERKWRKELKDVSSFTTKPTAFLALNGKGISVLAETSEVISILDNRVVKVISEAQDLFVSMLITDQAAFTPCLSPATMRLEFNLPRKMENMRRIQRLVEMSVFLADQIAVLKLSSQVRARCVAARSKIAQVQLKLTHAERQEQLQKKKLEALEQERASLSGEALRKFEERQERISMRRRGHKMKIMR